MIWNRIRNRSLMAAAILMLVAAAAAVSAVANVASGANVAAAGGVPSPEDYFGFPVGADRKLADYEEVREYLGVLAETSQWIELRRIGTTTLGKPFVMAVISTPQNLGNLDRYIGISKRLADPRSLPPEEAKRLAAEGKLLVMITCNLHSTEIASSQMALELAYNVAAGRNAGLAGDLEETILFLVPSLNPDGLQMVVDWYEKWVGTEHEGCRMPWLYHHYAGHDNNRDWYMANLDETRAVFDLYFRTVVPHVILDMHQMWSTGARLFLPQFYAPANVNVDPVVYREVGLLGYCMQLACEERGMSGIISDAYFTAYWEGTSMMTPWWHNQVGLLSEAASASIATPVFIEEGELRGGSKGFPRYEHRINFPNPWPGGWWRLRDIVDYELAIAGGLMDCCAAHRERFLSNFYDMGARAVEAGRTEPPFAFVLPAPQRDPSAAARLAEILLLGGVEVHRAGGDFTAGDRIFHAGSYVIRMDQPYRAYAKDLLEVQEYPDIRASTKEPFVRPYDVTGWTVPYQMGVECVAIERKFAAPLELIEAPPCPGVTAFPAEPGWGYLLPAGDDASYRAAFALIEEGFRLFRADGEITIRGERMSHERVRGGQIPHGGKLERSMKGSASVRRVEHGDTGERPDYATAAVAGAVMPPGSFVIPAQKGLMKLSLPCADPVTLDRKPKVAMHTLEKRTVLLFKPWMASMDEGWTRLLFDRYGVPYRNVSNEDIKGGKLDRNDILIIPDIAPSIIKNGKPTGEWARHFRPLPPDYSGGIEKEGIEKIKKFVADGGTLICLDSSCEFAIEAFGLPVRNVLGKVKSDEFYCPGAILEVSFKTGNPITYGMPESGYIYFTGSPAFSTSIPYGKYGRTVLASYGKKDPLASGLLIGGERLHRRAALVEMRYEKGTIVLFGFRPQHRCQTVGTFKLLFNAILEAGPPAGERR